MAEAGHEITFYPSFYPQEVAVRFTSPATAAALLRQNKIHAYAGGDPFAGGAAPAHVRFTESLRGFVVLSFPRAVGAFAGADARCAAGAAMLRALAGRAPFVAHPYPITPYHDDYVAHVDLVQKARDRVAGALPRVRATGALAAALAAVGVPRGGADAEAVLEEIELPALLATAETRLNGWIAVRDGLVRRGSRAAGFTRGCCSQDRRHARPPTNRFDVAPRAGGRMSPSA